MSRTRIAATAVIGLSVLAVWGMSAGVTLLLVGAALLAVHDELRRAPHEPAWFRETPASSVVQLADGTAADPARYFFAAPPLAP